VTLFEKALIAHLIADWFLQNRWQSDHKVNLRHRAAWVHSGIHLAALLCVFWFPMALAVAVTHLLIDTRKPLEWWRGFYGQTTEGPMAIHVAIWQDQASHVLVLAAAAWLQGAL
jgi:hypothetical protein